MNDPQSEAEKIRNKRLAKLGQPSQSSSSSSGPQTPAAPSPAESSKAGNEAVETNKTPATQVPPSHISPAPVIENAVPVKKIKITPISSPAPQNVSSKSKPLAGESFEQWSDRTISSIFRVTVNESQKTDAHGSKLMFLPDVRAELDNSGQSPLLKVDDVEQIIIEAASKTPDGKPLTYLVACFKRTMRAWRVHKDDAGDSRFAAVKEIKRLCVSYCIFAATMPEMFNVESSSQNPLVDHLLNGTESESGVCHDLLTELVLRFPDDDSIKDLLVGAMEDISADLSKKTMNDNIQPSVSALRLFVRYPPLIDAMSKSEKFLPIDDPIEQIEATSLLGPFFALSPLHPDVALNYFMGAQARGSSYIISNQNAVRLTLRTHQDELFEITNAIIKSAKEPRERILDWFAHIINKNHKRRATYVDTAHVSSDGFMVNITTVLDRLCEPFMDSTFAKVNRIDVNYLRRSPRVEIADETKLNADQKTSDEFYAIKDNGTNNFITEIFFLTVAAHHYGTESIHAYLTRLEREVKHFERELQKMESERAKFAAHPAQLVIFERHLKRYKDQLEKTRCVIEAIRGVLLDEPTQQRSMLLMRYIITWLLRIVQPETLYPNHALKLPLSEEQPQVFACLPEYLLEDIVDNFKFITSHLPQVILPTQCEELVAICVTFLRNSEYVKNPYLKAGLVSILSHGVYQFRNKPNGTLGDLLTSSTFCHKHLLHALMKFYIEAEHTGGHNAFYEKFSIRYEIFQVIRCIWSSSIYRKNLEQESKVNVEFFIQFVNLLLNDVTYVLNEAFRAFNEIHNIQELLDNPTSELDENGRKEKEEQLESLQRQAKGNMQLTNETVSMLKLFTEVLAEAFTMPEIVQRLADMLDYNLDLMVGPKQRNLKVKDLASYHFNPKALLSDITSVYSNLAGQSSFLLAIARDGRSYKPENFDKAANIMEKTDHKSPEQLQAFRQLARKIRKVYEADQEEEEEMGDIPDEFIDPILATLMSDPVILPNSRNVVDRSTIRTLLLSDPTDPFNRMPLKIEEVIPDTELKEKIMQFKAEAKAKKLKAAADITVDPQTGDDKMDLS